MIYIKVELWPGGNESRKVTLAEATIANISNLADVSSYSYKLFGKKRSRMGAGEIHGFPRKRLMAWDLVRRVLNDARSRRGPDSDRTGTPETEQEDAEL